jgi:hypothetical protein
MALYSASPNPVSILQYIDVVNFSSSVSTLRSYLMPDEAVRASESLQYIKLLSKIDRTSENSPI